MDTFTELTAYFATFGPLTGPWRNWNAAEDRERLRIEAAEARRWPRDNGNAFSHNAEDDRLPVLAPPS